MFALGEAKPGHASAPVRAEAPPPETAPSTPAQTQTRELPALPRAHSPEETLAAEPEESQQIGVEQADEQAPPGNPGPWLPGKGEAWLRGREDIRAGLAANGFTPAEIARYLPSPDDSPEGVKRKLDAAQDELKGRLAMQIANYTGICDESCWVRISPKQRMSASSRAVVVNKKLVIPVSRSEVPPEGSKAPLGDGYQRSAWGMSIGTVARLYPAGRAFDNNSVLAVTSAAASRPAAVNFYFGPNGLHAVDVRFSEIATGEQALSAFDDAGDGLKTRYGKPHQAVEWWKVNRRNDSTAEFERSLGVGAVKCAMLWNGETTRVLLEAKYDPDRRRPIVVVSYRPAGERAAAVKADGL